MASLAVRHALPAIVDAQQRVPPIAQGENAALVVAASTTAALAPQINSAPAVFAK